MNSANDTSLHYDFNFGVDSLRRECRFPVKHWQELSGQPFYNRYDRIGTAFCRSIRPELADLVEVATALYLADRFSPRRHPDRSGDSQALARHITLKIGVRQPGRWLGKAKEVLEELLWYLCGDVWELSFESLPDGAGVTSQEFLLDFVPVKPAMVMLFSGGLDSFAGAAAQLEDTEHFHVLVSGRTHPRMSVEQEGQARLLLDGRVQAGHRVEVPYGLPHKAPKEGGPLKLESSQRTRGIIHVVLGAVAALQLGTNRLHIYENGIGALNLPFDETQSGWEVSRAVHPRTLRMLERLIGEISGEAFRVELPFLFQTKAESLSHPEVRRFAHGIRSTFSCDRFPLWREGKRQCGTCSSCVLRRLALESAGLAQFDPASQYAFDVESADAVPKRSAAFVLDKFDAQAEHFLRANRHANPWRELTRHCPELRDVEAALVDCGLTLPDVHQKLMRLLNQHAKEWMNFSGRGALARYLHAA
jgi:hypothetical protein